MDTTNCSEDRTTRLEETINRPEDTTNGLEDTTNFPEDTITHQIVGVRIIIREVAGISGESQNRAMIKTRKRKIQIQIQIK
jgi:predicted FMN-binding regulatory protein PaiB